VPGNKTVEIGSDVELECRYISAEAAHVSWLKHYMVNGSFADENKVAYVTILQVLFVVEMKVHFVMVMWMMMVINKVN